MMRRKRSLFSSSARPGVDLLLARWRLVAWCDADEKILFFYFTNQSTRPAVSD
jgi:hypothetical protein